MSPRHLEDAALTEYVAGTLDAHHTALLEAHVIGCADCAARLQRFAWLETAMFEAAAQMHPPRARRSWGQRLQQITRMPAGLALAASLVLGLGVPERWLELDVGTGVRVARAEVGDGHGSTPWDDAPACAAPEDSGGETCDDPTVGELEGDAFELIAMTWPDEETTNLCVDGSELECPGGEPLDG